MRRGETWSLWPCVLCGYNGAAGLSQRNSLPLLKRIATAVVLIPIVLALILRAPVSVLAVVAGVVALLTIHEFLKLTESYGVQPMGCRRTCSAAIFFFCWRSVRE